MKERQPIYMVADKKPHMEILSKGGTGISCISRVSKAQMTSLIRIEATPPGNHCGRGQPGRKLKTSGAKAPSMGLSA